MKQHFLAFFFAFAVIFGSQFTAIDAKADFDSEQRQEIGEIVRQYLLENPQLLREVIAELERHEQSARTKAAEKAIVENAANLYRSSTDLIAGNPDGNVTLVEFFDYNCHFCKRSLPDILALIENDDDLRVVMKEFPILGPDSLYASRAAVASAEQGKYWEFHLALMEHHGTVNAKVVERTAKKLGLDVDKLKADMEAPKVTQKLEENLALAQRLQIEGTPAFVVDDNLVVGAVGLEQLFTAIDTVRSSGGCRLC